MFMVPPRYLRCLCLGWLLLAAVLSGCGQKGPLYLPDPPPAQEDSDDDA